MVKQGKSSQKRISELEASVVGYVSEVGKLEFKVGELKAELNRLHAELNHRKGLRNQASTLYRTVDDAIIARIDRKGFNRKTKKRRSGIVIPNVALSKEEAQGLAVSYDAQTYFRYHSPKTGMLLRYRVVSKGYRIARDTVKYGAKSAFRMARKVAR